MVWGIEASGYVTYTHSYMKNGTAVNDEFFHNKEKKWSEYLAENKYKATDFQAIVLLPFFANGSEKLWVGNDLSAFPEGICASIELHLPIVDVMMSRTSWSLTEKQVKLIAGPYADKPMLGDLKSKKPFLLIKATNSDFTPYELYLLQASDYLGNYFQSDIYACYPERILANDKKYADTIGSILPYMHNPDTCIINKGSWYVNHFDVDTSIPRFFGKGAVPDLKVEQKIIATIPVKPQSQDQLYELSCWFLVTDKDFSSPYITLQLLDDNKKSIRTIDMLTKCSVDNQGMWFRAFLFFKIPANCTSISCNLLDPSHDSYIAMDELMLRPAEATIISKTEDGAVMVNNHLFHVK